MKFIKFTLLIFAFLFSFSWSQENSDDETYKYLQLFGEALDNIKRHYVDEVSDKDLIESAIKGMLQSLDPHSAYLDEESFKNLSDQTSGQFGGLGIEISLDKDGYILIISPIDGTPADRAGLQSGDLIVTIDGKIVLGMSLSEAVKLMRGEPNTEIDLEILRGKETFELTITRAIITVEAVKSEMKSDNIGYIRISSFSKNTAVDLRKAVKELRRGDIKPQGYILDLRNNPGGLLTQAIKVSDSFLERGEIVSTAGRDGDRGDRFQAKSGDIIDGAPLLVLINGGSASASEIVAGALKDLKRALIVGSPSFGKGSVQVVLPLSQKEHGLKLTTQRYYTPSGESIQAKGIVPNIEIVPSTVTPIEQGRRRFEADLPKALDNEDKQTEEVIQEEQETKESDYVLMRAIEIITAIVLHEQSHE